MVEIIPKEVPRVPQWINVLFYVLLFLLIVGIVGFFVLNNFLKTSLNTLESLKSELKAKEVPAMVDLENEIKSYRNKFQDFSILLEDHKETTKSLGFLEQIVHPLVWFSSFNLTPQDERIDLKGEAKDFDSLGQQLFVLQDEKKINDFQLSNIAINRDGNVDFSLTIFFKPGFLNAEN